MTPHRANEIICKELPAEYADIVMEIGKALCMPMTKAELNEWRKVFWGPESTWDSIRKDR